ncbi:MAG: OsmC family protein [Candidatus Acetothermia bacterium]
MPEKNVVTSSSNLGKTKIARAGNDLDTEKPPALTSPFAPLTGMKYGFLSCAHNPWRENMQSTAKWIDNYTSVLDNGRKHACVVDLPPAEEGDDFGPSALELTNMSLAGCLSTIYMVIANKMRLEISDLEVKVEATKGEDAPTITSAHVTINVHSEERRSKLEKCLDQTLKTCPVGQLFEQAGVEMEHELNVE